MGSAQGKRVAVLVEKFYEDLELWYPVMRLREAGCDVKIVGPKAGETYASKHGYPAKSDVAASEVKASDFDAIIIPGGYSPDHMRRHPPMVDLVTQAAKQGKILASICHGPWMLCSAKCLKGKKVTGFFAIRDDVENAGGIWQDAACVRDGNIVTSRTPDDLPAFMQGILSRTRRPVLTTIERIDRQVECTMRSELTAKDPKSARNRRTEPLPVQMRARSSRRSKRSVCRP